MGRQSFLEPENWLGRQETAVFLRRTLSRGSQNGIGVFSLTEAGERQIGWVPEKDQATMGDVLKACHLPNFHDKIDSTSTKYIGHNFTKVTTFIIIIIKNIYIIKIVTLVKLFVKAPWCRRCQHRTHYNRTPPY